MHIRSVLMAGTAAALSFGMAASALAATKTTKTTTTDTTTVAAAQMPTQAQIDDLERQVTTMATQLQYMKRQMELMQERANPAAGAATVTLANGRPQLQSYDGNFKFNLQARSHTDFANYFGTAPGLQLNNGVNQRRAYLTLNSTFYKDFDTTFELDFGNNANENKTTGYVRTMQITWNGASSGLGNLKFDLGYMEPKFSFERGMSSNNTLFMERSSPEQIAASIGADDRRFAVGFSDYGDMWYGNIYYTGARTAIGNTDGINATNIKNEQSTIIGRATFLPYQDANTYIHVGINGQYLLSPNEMAQTIAPPRRTVGLSFRPGLNVDNQSFINTGALPANSASVIGGEFAAEWKNFAFLAQDFHYTIDTINPIAGVASASPAFDAFDLNLSYVLTGESRGYDKASGAFNAVVPSRNFNPAAGGWGALELLARFEQSNLNDREGNFIVEGGRQTLYEVGADWYWNRNIRFMFDYIYADIRRGVVLGNGTTAARIGPSAPGSNLQPAFSAIASRAQFNF